MASQLKFCHFPRLPGELRQNIWTIACTEPRMVFVEYSEHSVGSIYTIVENFGPNSRESSKSMESFRFRTQIPAVLQANQESRECALKIIPLFFQNAPQQQRNTYFNPLIDTCYVALGSQPYKIKDLAPKVQCVGPSDEVGDNNSWNFEHLSFGTALLSSPDKFPDFPRARFMAVDETFLQENNEQYKWERFFKYIPSIERFTFVLNGNSMLSKGTRIRNSEAIPIWSEIEHPSVLKLKVLE